MDRRSFLAGISAFFAAAPSINPLKSLNDLQTLEEMSTPSHMLVRSTLWSKQIKELLLEELTSMKFNKVFKDD